MWSVDDGGTQAIMSAFYSILSTEKLTKTEALRQAQVSLITGNWKEISHNAPVAAVNDFSHPYYWAPFILHWQWTLDIRAVSRREVIAFL